MPLSRFEHSVYMLADMTPAMDRVVSDLTGPGMSSDRTEVTDARIFTELNHALQTPLRGLSYAFQNLANLPDDVLLQERAKRLAGLTAMLDSCTSALATFGGLVDTVASVPTRQPSLDEAIRSFSGSIQHPSGRACDDRFPRPA